MPFEVVFSWLKCVIPVLLLPVEPSVVLFGFLYQDFSPDVKPVC